LDKENYGQVIKKTSLSSVKAFYFFFSSKKKHIALKRFITDHATISYLFEAVAQILRVFPNC